MPKKIRRTTSADRKEPKGNAEKITDLTSAEFAYQVAVYAWRDGLTANAILRKLNLPPKPVHLMQVKRALLRAHGMFLTLHPPLNEDLQNRLLDKISHERLRLHVVDDTRVGETGPVFAKAAEVAVDIIKEITQRKNPQSDAEQVIICNAGGRSVSEVVRVLSRNPPLLDAEADDADQMKKRLLFVAANAAYLPRDFQMSSNFLAVTLAEIFGARHFALPRKEARLHEEHKKLVSRARLLICGAGTRASGLMHRYFQQAGVGADIPSEAIGDLAFNLLNKDGDLVEMAAARGQKLLKRLNPSLDLLRLANIAHEQRVLLILDDGTINSPQKQSQDGSSGHKGDRFGKELIAAAILRKRYATDVVLGAKFAERVLRVL